MRYGYILLMSAIFNGCGLETHGVTSSILAASDTASEPVSHGTGGEPGHSTMQVEGIDLKIWAPETLDASQPLQLAIYLHGDGAADFDSDDQSYSSYNLQQKAVEAGLLYVKMGSPILNSSVGRSWWDGTGQTEKFVQALKKLQSLYNVYTRRTLYSGVSGGSTFLSMLFIGQYGDQYPGAIAAMCGGAAPKSIDYTLTDELKELIPITFTHTDGDYLASSTGAYGAVIPAAVEAFKENGFNTIHDVVSNNQPHCAFDVGTYAWKFLSQHLVAANTSTRPAQDPSTSTDTTINTDSTSVSSDSTSVSSDSTSVSSDSTSTEL